MKERKSLTLGQVLLRHMLFRLFLPLLAVGFAAIGGAGYLGIQALINEQKQVAQSMA
ncbi:MAG: hypothetical protein PHN75_14550 [Syntrophales bacterium]|nr:hypothetical protein [Syntrophales bacterium]